MSAELPTKLLLARHGDVAGIDPPRFRGRADPGLSERGQEQARRLGARLTQKWAVAKLYTSPRERCRITARPFAEAVRLEPEVLAELEDLDYGAWTWRTHEEVQAGEPHAFACWHSNPELTRFPEGESLQDLLARAADALRRVLERHRGETVLFVTHDSVVRALILQLTGLPLTFYHQITVSPCSVSEVEFDGLDPRLVRVNETAHLDVT